MLHSLQPSRSESKQLQKITDAVQFNSKQVTQDKLTSVAALLFPGQWTSLSPIGGIKQIMHTLAVQVIDTC